MIIAVQVDLWMLKLNLNEQLDVDLLDSEILGFPESMSR